MINPTSKEMNDLFSRLAKAGWISEAYVVEDASAGDPLGMVPTPKGHLRLLDLYRSLLELGKPAPTEGEWAALFGLILRYGQKNSNPEPPPSDRP